VPGAVELDLAAHSVALLTAVGEIEPHLQEWLAEMPDDDARRPDRTGELDVVQQFESAARRAVARIERNLPADALAIPPVLVGRVREGAYVSRGIENCRLIGIEKCRCSGGFGVLAGGGVEDLVAAA